MNRNLLLPVLAIFTGCLLASGCKSNATNQAPSFAGEQGWAIENIDPTFWTNAPPATMYRNFWIYAEDPDGAQDIVYIAVTDSSGHYWTLQDDYDPTYDYWGGWGRCYDSSSPDMARLGSYEVLVRDSAGHEITTTIACNGPAGESGFSFVYSEAYSGNLSGGTPALRKATSLDGTRDADQITVKFTVDDARVHEGWLWLYDSSGHYIGWTDRFWGIINSGSGIYTDDSLNTLVMSSTQLKLESGHSFTEVAGFEVVLTDGGQYTEPTWYDYRSISAHLDF
jgi:hypothetical protein